MDLYDKKNVLSFCTTHCIPISDTIHKTQIPRKDVNQTCSISKKNLSSQNIHILHKKNRKTICTPLVFHLNELTLEDSVLHA